MSLRSFIPECFGSEKALGLFPNLVTRAKQAEPSKGFKVTKFLPASTSMHNPLECELQWMDVSHPNRRTAHVLTTEPRTVRV